MQINFHTDTLTTILGLLPNFDVQSSRPQTFELNGNPAMKAIISLVHRDQHKMGTVNNGWQNLSSLQWLHVS